MAITVLAVVVMGLEVCAALAIYTLLTFVTGVTDAVAVPVLGDLQDLAGPLSRRAQMAFLAAFTGAVFLLRGASYISLVYTSNRLAQNSGARVASRLFRGYLRMPYAFHLRRNSAELIRNLHGATYEFASAIFLPSIAIVSESLLVAAILAVLVLQAPGATALTIGTIAPAVLLLLRGVQPVMTRLGLENQQLHKTNIETQQQAFQGVRDIKVLGRESTFESIFDRSRFGVARTYYLRATLSEVPRVAIETLLILFVLLYLGLVLIRDESLEAALATLGLFGYAMMRVLPSLSRIITHVNNLRFGSAALDLLAEDLSMVDAEAQGEEDGGVLPFEQQVHLDGVSFRYESSDVPALSDVQLRVARGEAIGLIGPSGGGKSTFVDVMIGLLPPTDGVVRVDGRDIRDATRAWQRNVAVVFQTVFLLDDSIRKNVAFGVQDEAIDDERVRSALEVAQLMNFVDTLPEGWHSQVGEGGVRLSGGQRQRIAIARAIYRDAKLLVLDEGTSALDDSTENEFIAALAAVRGSTTLIVVAHRRSTLRVCDRILMVDAGRVSDVGTYDDMIKSGLAPVLEKP